MTLILSDRSSAWLFNTYARICQYKSLDTASYQPITHPWCSRSATVNAHDAINRDTSTLYCRYLCPFSFGGSTIKANASYIVGFIMQMFRRPFMRTIMNICKRVWTRESCSTVNVYLSIGPGRTEHDVGILCVAIRDKSSSMNFLRNCKTLQNAFKCPKHVCTSEWAFKPVFTGNANQCEVCVVVHLLSYYKSWTMQPFLDLHIGRKQIMMLTLCEHL